MQYSDQKLTDGKIKNQRGKVLIKFLWWPLIISIAFSILFTIFLNLAFKQ